MKLSVVIVNYNVKHFLEQCLNSVFKALEGVEAEVFVVDNNSVDSSNQMIREKFPNVIHIENKVNVGFSKANNQAIQRSKGEYVLLLNPDTVVEDDTFKKVIAFMDSHADAGALGVKMIDGKGKFLPESKRGLPTPSVAFYKIFGLSKVFPKSKRFGKYHLGYLDKDQTHKVDVLSGAFMLLRKQVLEEIGLLDESFFMYGEDIDLSYRVIKAGYNNYYYPETRIIHYKGESTKKSSVNYVFVFYNAMIIFARKHFSKKNASFFKALINIAIYFRAALALGKRFLNKIYLPLTDALLGFAGIYFIKNYWEFQIIGSYGNYYPKEFMSVVVPLMILVWLLSLYLNGGYDKPIRFRKVFQGVFVGTVFILVVYALLDEKYRFSRAIIMLSAAWSLTYMLGMRYIMMLLNINGYNIEKSRNKRFAIIGQLEESQRVAEILHRNYPDTSFIGIVENEKEKTNNQSIGTLNQIKEIIEIYKINEIVFCAKDIASQEIINQMLTLKHLEVDFKIAPPESLYIIGSKSIETVSDMFALNVNSITKPENKRNKRIFDITFSLILLISFPIALFFIKKPLKGLMNVFSVLFFTKSWVGVNIPNQSLALNLKRGVLSPTDALKKRNLDNDTILRINLLYIRDYNLNNDIRIVLNGFSYLGR